MKLFENKLQIIYENAEAFCLLHIVTTFVARSSEYETFVVTDMCTELFSQLQVQTGYISCLVFDRYLIFHTLLSVRQKILHVCYIS